MNCAEARELWHDHLDGLSGSAAAEFDAHASACDECRVWRDQMRQVAGALDELRVQTERIGIDPGRDREGVVATIGRPRRRTAPWWTIGRIAAGIALMIGAGSYVYNNRTSTPGGETSTAIVVDPPVEPAPVPASMVLTGASENQYISVRHETSSPSVHVFRLYRAYQRPDTETSDS